MVIDATIKKKGAECIVNEFVTIVTLQTPNGKVELI
jgi:hypothetical protein